MVLGLESLNLEYRTFSVAAHTRLELEYLLAVKI